jgi:hypothetical protein
MFETVITILGLTAAAVYVSYLAYAIHSVPLWIIVIATFALAIRELLVELRGEGTGKSG